MAAEPSTQGTVALVRELLARRLGADTLEQVRDDDCLSDIGADSVTLIMVAAELEVLVGRNVDDAVVLAADTTIAGIARAIRAAS